MHKDILWQVLGEIQPIIVPFAWLIWRAFRSLYTTPLESYPLVLHKSKDIHPFFQACFSSVTRSIQDEACKGMFLSSNLGS